jgi:pyruvate kinase
MLSAESAAGKYPVESVTMQQLIINKVEVNLLAVTLALTLTLAVEH